MSYEQAEKCVVMAECRPVAIWAHTARLGAPAALKAKRTFFKQLNSMNRNNQAEDNMQIIIFLLICVLPMGCVRLYYNIAPEFHSDGIVNVDGRLDADDPRVTVTVDDVTVDWKELKTLIEKQMANSPRELKLKRELVPVQKLVSTSVSHPATNPMVADSKPRMTHSVQVGAFRRLENAEQAIASLSAKGHPAQLVQITDSRKQNWYTVRIGDFPSIESARARADEFVRRENMQSVVRPYGSL
jgi:hypothetical protein